MKAPAPFQSLKLHHYGALLVDPPWSFKTWSKRGEGRSAKRHYQTMTFDQLKVLPVQRVAADDCVLFLWATWPLLIEALLLMAWWGFEYKTCAFDWMKVGREGFIPVIGTGYWTRANTEACLLGTRGNPKRWHKGIPMAILEPRREHSRKPDCVHERIELLVKGPYLELFARQRRKGWTTWGDQTTAFSGRG